MARSSRTAKVIFFWYRFGIGWGIGGHGLRSYKKTLARTPTVCTVAKVCRQCFGSGSLAHMSGGLVSCKCQGKFGSAPIGFAGF